MSQSSRIMRAMWYTIREEESLAWNFDPHNPIFASTDLALIENYFRQGKDNYLGTSHISFCKEIENESYIVCYLESLFPKEHADLVHRAIGGIFGLKFLFGIPAIARILEELKHSMHLEMTETRFFDPFIMNFKQRETSPFDIVVVLMFYINENPGRREATEEIMRQMIANVFFEIQSDLELMADLETRKIQNEMSCGYTDTVTTPVTNALIDVLHMAQCDDTLLKFDAIEPENFPSTNLAWIGSLIITVIIFSLMLVIGIPFPSLRVPYFICMGIGTTFYGSLTVVNGYFSYEVQQEEKPTTEDKTNADRRRQAQISFATVSNFFNLFSNLMQKQRIIPADPNSCVETEPERL